MENTSEGAGFTPRRKGTGGWGGEQLTLRLQSLAQDYCHENHELGVSAASFPFLPSALQLLFLCRVRPRSRLKFEEAILPFVTILIVPERNYSR